MNKEQMVIHHIHTEYTNPQVIDSVTSMDDYIDKAKDLGMKAIGRTEHGNIYEWLKIKSKVEKAGMKYMHGAEFYVTEKLEPKIRDNYHFVLYAKNTSGKKELNKLIKISNQLDHRYYSPRITLDELYNTSENILITTACMANLLWSGRDNVVVVDNFLKWASANSDRIFLEVQPHVSEDQKKYNKMLLKYSKEYNIRLIAGTDTHSLNKIHQEARMLIKYAKGFRYNNEDDFDLTFYGREVAEKMFRRQGVLSEKEYNEAIDNTIVFADMIEGYEVSSNFKYPELYDNPEKVLKDMTMKGFNKYKKLGVITDKNKDEYINRIKNEIPTFKKLGMESFIAFMGELSQWCDDNNIQRGDGRGSGVGSVILYLLDITDVDPVKHNTIFSRFCNESRISLGDVDLDFGDSDRPRVFKYITDRFSQEYTARVVTFGTMAYKGAIDEIIRGIDNRHKIKNGTSDFIYGYDKASEIKNLFAEDEKEARAKYPEVFELFDVILDTIIQVGTHAGGVVASPILLEEHVGVSLNQDSQTKEYMWVTNCSKKVLENHGYVKYDILGLKNMDILKYTYQLSNRKYEKSHEIDWDDKKVWDEMLKHPAGIFQFTGDYAFSQLKKMNPSRIKDMSITNALLRPSGASIRDDYYNDVHFKNPSKEIDEMFEDQKGYVIFQEDTIAYLQDICGLSGSEADTLRRAIGAKDHEMVNKWLPKVREGYRKHVGKPKEIAYSEVDSFIKILSDSADYQFGYNHSTGYSMLGYRCARERLYHPLEFTTAFLKTAKTDEDIRLGMDLANYKNIKIMPLLYGKSTGDYFMNHDDFAIYNGTKNVKYLNEDIGDKLYELAQSKTHNSFIELLYDIDNTSVNSRQLEILIKLDYFNEFGNDKKLFVLYKYFNNLNSRKQLHKETNRDIISLIEKVGISEEFIANNSLETNKLYKEINFKKILFKIENNIPNISFGIKDKLDVQLEYLTYINKQYDVDKKLWYVIEIADYKNPYMKLHNIRTGDEKSLKLFKYDIEKNTRRPKPMDILMVEKAVWQRKNKKVGGEWIKSEDKQLVLKKYNILG